ncbi:hypothetical protein BP00DRAFT_262717 [Aspergillus indologenus CBS 114.80]|uniref:Uncharacterized protein n=1 Tax=Aspergillus indologenus CBS 114.80 TaxID=1450541 RepID=A0A2V5HVA6_9EURO|nr:hypothetical protein BP00DRAFT_262717 [Aspergillus indologenus CBS 114.80]
MTNARNWSGFGSWHGIHKAFETAQAIMTMIFGWLIIADTIRALTKKNSHAGPNVRTGMRNSLHDSVMIFMI